MGFHPKLTKKTDFKWQFHHPSEGYRAFSCGLLVAAAFRRMCARCKMDSFNSGMLA
jgi:hypothetical protein